MIKTSFSLLFLFCLSWVVFAQETQEQVKVTSKNKKPKYHMSVEAMTLYEVINIQNSTNNTNANYAGKPNFGAKFILMKPDLKQFTWYSHLSIRTADVDRGDDGVEPTGDNKDNLTALGICAGAIYKANIGLLSSLKLIYEQDSLLTPAFNDDLSFTKRMDTVWIPKIHLSLHRSVSRHSGVEMTYEHFLSSYDKDQKYLVKGGRSVELGYLRWMKSRKNYWKLSGRVREHDIKSYIYKTTGAYLSYGWLI